MDENAYGIPVPEFVSSTQQAGDVTVSPGSEEPSNASIEMVDQLCVMKEQQKLEYTRDGSVDFRGKPAVISRVGGHRSLAFTLGCMFLIRVAYDGVTYSLVLYLTRKLHINNSKAASVVSNWVASTTVFSLLGAIVADSYFGRYWTTLGSMFIHIIGLLILVITTVLPSLEPYKCTRSFVGCTETTGRRIQVFYLGLYIIAVGFGSFLPCFISFGADQYDEGHPVEVHQKSLYFSLLYVVISSGGLIGNSIIIYIEQNVSYKWGYSISVGFIGISLLVYVAGTPYYRFQKPRGNPVSRVIQVWVAATRKWRMKVSAPNNHLYEAPVEKAISRRLLHSNQFRFLDKAATINISLQEIDESQRNPWKLCTVTQVEEAKFLFQIAPIWLSLVVYSTLDVQILSLFVEQAATMDNRLSKFLVPPASMSIFQILGVCVCTFTYETVVVPIIRRFTGHPRGLTMLQRISVGLLLIVFSMLSAALVEMNRLRIAKDYGLHNSPTARVPLSIFWLFPQYFLVGASEAFTDAGQFEFFYDQAPEGIRGISTSLQFTAYSVGSYLSSFMIVIVTAITRHGADSGWISDKLNKGHLDYFFWLLMLLGSLNLVSYLTFTHRYKYKKVVHVQATDPQ
ncbi:hypothetical protein O6H91_05G001000 [Diphasiastrum complanatum]|uniref:Uncharacterized protein n=1 Tax=Diphasiastrum complanatum TaxID=34168 RepID=A0ACC2DJV9_DIPCM|nr:hypothetical protein O6H91_Y359000 [Diphasiastrum complanatum]KAJ7554609.1 hypothetical protein O6H91_05G001000 [Diphasiastrum complanatum]